MAYAVFCDVAYQDQPGRINVRTYRLLQTLANDGSDMAAVITARDALKTQLDLLTDDKIAYIDTRIRALGTGAAPSIVANNIDYAFTRCLTVNNKKSGFHVNSWDDTIYSQDTDGMLSAAYDTVATAVAALTVDPETGDAWSSVWSQARGRKLRKRQSGTGA